MAVVGAAYQREKAKAVTEGRNVSVYFKNCKKWFPMEFGFFPTRHVEVVALLCVFPRAMYGRAPVILPCYAALHHDHGARRGGSSFIIVSNVGDGLRRKHLRCDVEKEFCLRYLMRAYIDMEARGCCSLQAHILVACCRLYLRVSCGALEL
jgi:hypothetical protein